jgi:hypothetical protein
MEMLEEAVQIVDRMLTQRPCRSGSAERGTRNGSAGFRVRAALRSVAQDADFCNVGGDLTDENTFGLARKILRTSMCFCSADQLKDLIP